MILTLDAERLRTPAEARAFLGGSRPVDFRLVDRSDASFRPVVGAADLDIEALPRRQVRLALRPQSSSPRSRIRALAAAAWAAKPSASARVAAVQASGPAPAALMRITEVRFWKSVTPSGDA